MPDELAEMATLRKLTRVEFNNLLELGTFAESERVELIDGLLVNKPNAGPEHARPIRRLTRLLVLAFQDSTDVEVDVQNPFAAGDHYQPLPDLAVIPRHDDRLGLPSEAYLMIEVSRSRLRFDRIVKARLYARIGVPEYWIVNVVDSVVEVHRDPTPDGYRVIETHRAGDTITLVSFPAVSVAVADVL